MRYEGHTYDAISRAIGRKIGAATMRQYFAIGGQLHLAYAEYEAKMNDWNTKTAKDQIVVQAGYAWKIKRSILQKALKKGKLELANQILNEILDMAGVRPEDKSTVVHEHQFTQMKDDEFNGYLQQHGIDPTTGLRTGTPEAVTRQSLQN